jgi:hypothetical protein
MREIVTIHVTSFRGSIGGEHYYGRLDVQTKMTRVPDAGGGTKLITRIGHGVERHAHDGHELKRRIGAKEAAYLNKKDGEDGFLRGGGLRPGDETTRFNDVDSIVKAAIETFPTLFDGTDVLMFERKRYSDDYEVLVAPAEAMAAIGGPNNRRVREEWLMANGYMVLGDDPETQTGAAA